MWKFASIFAPLLLSRTEACAPVWYDGDFEVTETTTTMPCEVTGFVSLKNGLASLHQNAKFDIKIIGKALCLARTNLPSLPVFYKAEKVGKGKCAHGTGKEDVSMEISVRPKMC